ncbi:NAD-dependent protein deacetylase sirtuin-3, mitochondrial isoform X1 [Pleurodeles waltl]|uniref:NAD-dependent protein deacetylase sirtuin-3, mitochondrial isoform X1 n=2 Tax=Pleurodeles waltl TaxID=8319 RepID=UPI0037098552
MIEYIKRVCPSTTNIVGARTVDGNSSLWQGESCCLQSAAVSLLVSCGDSMMMMPTKMCVHSFRKLLRHQGLVPLTGFTSRAPLSVSFVKTGAQGQDGGKKRMSLRNVAEMLRERQCQRVVAMVGAGISTPSGIPDFRSPESGLYSNLQRYDLPYPEAIFELNYFLSNPRPFFTLASQLYPGKFRPNYAHYFLRHLHDRGQLLRLYTQNIDGLERVAGIPPSKLVEAHGTFATATCTVCLRSFLGQDFQLQILNGEIPYCSVCRGLIKPDIIFFGEELPRRFLLHLTDFPLADLLIIIGTSLEVEPFASLASAIRGSIPRLLINRELVGPFAWPTPRHQDVAELGDVIQGVQRFVSLLGWTDQVLDLMQQDVKKVDQESEKVF